MANPFTPEQISQILEEFFKVVGTRQYIGARYVPIFGRKGEEAIEWDNSAPYEPLTIVLYQGNSYTSRQYVPVGVEITNQEFWAITGNYNAQVELYRQEVRNLLPYDETPTEDSTKAVTSDGIKKAIDTAVSVETTRAKEAEQVNATAISDETTRAKEAEQANATAIANEVTRAKSAEQANADAIQTLRDSTEIAEQELTTVVNQIKKTGAHVFATVADMIKQNLQDGMTVIALRYNTMWNEPIPFIISNSNQDNAIELNNGKYACPIISKFVSPAYFGGYGDGIHDDSTAMQKAINYASINKKGILLYGTYLITKQINIPRETYITGTKYCKIVSTCSDFTFIAPYGTFSIDNLTFSGDYFLKISTSEYRAYNFTLSNIIAENCTTFLNMQYGTTYCWLYNCRASSKSNSTAPLIVLGGGFSQYEGSSTERRVQTNYVYMTKCSFAGQFKERNAQCIEIYGIQWLICNECDFTDCNNAIHITTNPLEIATNIWNIYFNNTTFFRCNTAFNCDRDFFNIQFNSSSFYGCTNALNVQPQTFGNILKLNNCSMQDTSGPTPIVFSNISNLRYDINTQSQNASSLVTLNNCHIIDFQDISQMIDHTNNSTRVGNTFNTMPIPYPVVTTINGTGNISITKYNSSYNIVAKNTSDDYVGRVS